MLAAASNPLPEIDALPRGYEMAQISAARAFTDDRGWVGIR